MRTRLEILTNAEMADADRLAVAAGVASLTLMENAGRAVADEAERMVSPGARILVLCGPGNNGGDGYVAAQLLAERGYQVHLAGLVAAEELQGDARTMAGRWRGGVEGVEGLDLGSAELTIDALFGAGLTRALEGTAARLVEALNASAGAVLAVDVPSGLDGSSGQARGPVVRAMRTVTFFRRKPGHLLLPGRELCGAVVLADIGIPDKVLDAIGCATFANAPGLWLGSYPWPRSSGHKYTRGHAVVVSGPAECTGAARLAARGALRAGAGLVTVASPRAAFPVNAAHLTAIMLKPFEVPDGLGDILADERRNAILVGPGCGVGAPTRRMVEIALRSKAAAVLDADALTSFAGEGEAVPRRMGFTAPAGSEHDAAATPEGLLGAIRTRTAAVVLTPHEGEFERLFAGLEGSRLERARNAASASGAVVVLKGPDTVIAAPDGRAAINENAPPWLATAGSGDVLAGFVVGLMAQGMPAFEAACAAVWLHGECAAATGPGLIAEDLPEQLPRVLRALHEDAQGRA